MAPIREIAPAPAGIAQVSALLAAQISVPVEETTDAVCSPAAARPSAVLHFATAPAAQSSRAARMAQTLLASAPGCESVQEYFAPAVALLPYLTGCSLPSACGFR